MPSQAGHPGTTHSLRGTRLRALRQLQREYLDTPYVFISERQTPLTARTVTLLLPAGSLATLNLTIHPHMLRHSTGFYLANKATIGVRFKPT